MDYFNVLATKIKSNWTLATTRLKTYFKKLLFPIYLFPIKFLTYTLYYLVIFVFKLILAFFGLIIDCVVFPFKSLKNLLKSIFIIGVSLYLVASLFVIVDYLTKQYGYIGKFFCAFGAKQRVEQAVVRVVGGQSEGTGFYITPNRIITSFHVIDGEPSPKIILPDGKFISAEKIVGDKTMDLAVISVGATMTAPLYLPDEFIAYNDEPMLAVGY